jgi:hypothetical protein
MWAGKVLTEIFRVVGVMENGFDVGGEGGRR